MQPINFNNKTFRLVNNSENGTSNSETTFLYRQEGNLVTADFSGGTVRYGKIIALHEGEQLRMVYQMITTGNELKAGQAIAQISRIPDGRIQLSLDWEWLEPGSNRGRSEYEEIPNKQKLILP